MCTTRLLPAVVLIAAGLPLLWLARRSLRAAAGNLRLLAAARRATPADFGHLAPGSVALRGRVVAIEPLTSAESGRRGVYLAWSADRWERTSTIGGLSGQWLRTEEDAEAAPFELTDGEQTVLVDPRGARIRNLPVVARELQLPGRVRYREQMIEDGAELLVIGHAEEHGGFPPSAGYRGHGFRLAVTDGGRGELTLAAPAGFVRQLALAAAGQLLGVVPLVVLVAIVAC